jgi:hypothetical protein
VSVWLGHARSLEYRGKEGVVAVTRGRPNARKYPLDAAGVENAPQAKSSQASPRVRILLAKVSR